MFPIYSIYSTSPRSHNGSDADGETGEESEGKPTDTPSPPHTNTVVTVDASREAWLEWKPMRLLKQGGSPLYCLSR